MAARNIFLSSKNINNNNINSSNNFLLNSDLTLFQQSNMDEQSSSNMSKSNQKDADSHKKDKNQCELCGKKYKNKYIKFCHLKQIHNLNPHTCKYCKDTFINIKSMREHVESEHYQYHKTTSFEGLQASLDKLQDNLSGLKSGSQKNNTNVEKSSDKNTYININNKKDIKYKEKLDAKKSILGAELNLNSQTNLLSAEIQSTKENSAQIENITNSFMQQNNNLSDSNNNNNSSINNNNGVQLTQNNVSNKFFLSQVLIKLEQEQQIKAMQKRLFSVKSEENNINLDSLEEKNALSFF